MKQHYQTFLGIGNRDDDNKKPLPSQNVDKIVMAILIIIMIIIREVEPAKEGRMAICS